MTGISRRQFGFLMAGALASPQLLALNKSGQAVFASAARNQAGQDILQLIGNNGQVLLNYILPARAHHIAAHPKRPWLAAIARRPGNFIDIVNYENGQLIKQIKSSGYFYGHGIFSADGRYFISTENNGKDQQSRVLVRDANNFSVLADYSSHGIGAHELALMPDNKTLVIANGGILTKDREKLNLDSMQPSLVYIDLNNGYLLEKVDPPAELHQLSIRHLDVNKQGKVVIALQFQGAKYEDVPLVALHQQGESLQLLKAPAAINQSMKQYAGSSRFDKSGRYMAISSPRGNLITFWDSFDGSYKSMTKATDGCGLAATNKDGEFLISTGHGKIYSFNIEQNKKKTWPLNNSEQVAWDNHLSML